MWYTGQITDERQNGWITLWDWYFHHTHSTHSSKVTLLRTAWVQLSRLCTDVRRFRCCLHKWGMASSAACEWCRRTNCQPCCPPMSNPLTLPWTAWPDSSGQSNGSSTPVVRSSASWQWTVTTHSNKEDAHMWRKWQWRLRHYRTGMHIAWQ